MDKDKIFEALKEVIDPEIGINIVDLGLVYGADINADNDVKITMTMTSMGCPLHAYLQAEVKKSLKKNFPDIGMVETQLVWDPVWSSEMMSAEAKQQLGW